MEGCIATQDTINNYAAVLQLTADQNATFTKILFFGNVLHIVHMIVIQSFKSASCFWLHGLHGQHISMCMY